MHINKKLSQVFCQNVWVLLARYVAFNSICKVGKEIFVGVKIVNLGNKRKIFSRRNDSCHVMDMNKVMPMI